MSSWLLPSDHCKWSRMHLHTLWYPTLYIPYTTFCSCLHSILNTNACLQKQTPNCLKALVKPSWSLQDFSQAQFDSPSYKVKLRLTTRPFSILAPRWWNELSLAVQTAVEHWQPTFSSFPQTMGKNVFRPWPIWSSMRMETSKFAELLQSLLNTVNNKGTEKYFHFIPSVFMTCVTTRWQQTEAAMEKKRNYILLFSFSSGMFLQRHRHLQIHGSREKL